MRRDTAEVTTAFAASVHPGTMLLHGTVSHVDAPIALNTAHETLIVTLLSVIRWALELDAAELDCSVTIIAVFPASYHTPSPWN